MTDYQPNSHRFKEEQKATERERVGKVVKGVAKIKKKSELRKVVNTFISEDASSVKSYILSDVLIPAVKKLISDIITDGTDIILFGGSGRGGKSSSSSKISYRNFYDQKSNRSLPSDPRTGSRFDFDDITFENRGEAEAVRAQMDEVVDRFGYVTVADLYDMSGLVPPFTSNKYGWTNVRNVEVSRLRNGEYALKLPKASPIDYK